jgi:hypothetical protein
MATLIRNYWEDEVGTNQQFHLAPGTWFSPDMLVRSLAEFVRHGRSLAERFNEATTVSFRIEWHGLKGRRIHDPWNMWLDNWIAHGDHRVATGSWPITMLKDAWPEMTPKGSNFSNRDVSNSSRSCKASEPIGSSALTRHADASIASAYSVYFSAQHGVSRTTLPNENAPPFDLGGSNAARISVSHDFKL